jgi:hypothetical protein
MKSIKIINILMGARGAAVILCLMLLWGFPQVGSAQDSQSAMGQLWIHRLGGEVLIKVEGNDEWASATINFPLQKGDSLWTSQGAWAQINHFGGSTIYLREQTLAEIEEFQKVGDQDQLRLALSKGKLYGEISGTASSSLIMQVDTPNLSVKAEPSTTLQVESVEAERYSQVSIIQGVAVVQTEGSSSQLEAGRTMIARGNGGIETEPMASIESPYPPTETPSASSYGYSGNDSGEEYVPEPLQNYTYDLNQYGYWTNVPEYGSVWVPTVVEAGWAPFSYGRWVFRSPNYVWVSYWPWGWVPFHYGRWGYALGIGWYWVPPYRYQVYWCPGAVGWWQTSSYVYWAPLAPGELYYGFGYFGPWSMNIGFYFTDHFHYVHRWPHSRDRFDRLGHQKFHNVRYRGAISGLSVSAFLHGDKNLKFANHMREGFKVDSFSAVPSPVIQADPQTMVPAPTKLVRRQDLPPRNSTWSLEWTQNRKAMAKNEPSTGTWQTQLWNNKKPFPGMSRIYNKSGTTSQKDFTDTHAAFSSKERQSSLRDKLYPPELKSRVRTDQPLRTEPNSTLNNNKGAYSTPPITGSSPVGRTDYGIQRNYQYNRQRGTGENSAERSPEAGAIVRPAKPQLKSYPAPSYKNRWQNPGIQGPPAPATNAPSRSWNRGTSWGNSSSSPQTPPSTVNRYGGAIPRGSFSAPRSGYVPSAPPAAQGGSRYSKGPAFMPGQSSSAPPAISRGGFSGFSEGGGGFSRRGFSGFSEGGGHGGFKGMR